MFELKISELVKNLESYKIRVKVVILLGQMRLLCSKQVRTFWQWILGCGLASQKCTSSKKKSHPMHHQATQAVL